MRELPNGWTESTLAQVSRWGSGGTPKADNPSYYNGQIPWAVIGDLTDGLVTSTAMHITDRGLAESSAKLVAPGSVLIAMYGSIGKLGIADVPMATNQAIAFAHPYAEVIDCKYLFYYLRSQRHLLNGAGKGATQQNISQTILKAWPVPLAPRAEQERIVAAIEEQFSQLDAGVAALERARQNLNGMRTAIVRSALRGELVPQDPEDELVKTALLNTQQAQSRTSVEAVDTDGNASWVLPSSWAWVHWESILAQDKGAFKRGPFGSALTKAVFVDSGYKVYEQYCPINDDCSFARYYITSDKYKELEGFAVRAGDFLISCSGSLGRITQVPNHYDPGVINQALLRVRLNNQLIDDNFFKMVFRSSYFQDKMLKNSTGTAMANVKGVKDLKAIPLPLPPLAEQKRILAEVERCETLARILDQSFETLSKRTSALRFSLLSAAFSGKLVPQDPTDEPASVLLERIAAERASSTGKKTPSRHAKQGALI